MPVEGSVLSVTTSPFFDFWLYIKIAILLLTGLYFFFSLIIVRQVHLMTETVITESAPLARAFSIIHAGLALGIIILFIGIFFG